MCWAQCWTVAPVPRLRPHRRTLPFTTWLQPACHGAHTCLAALSLQALSQALSFNTVLTSLELPCNNISGEGALFFATALRVYNHTLRTLDLQGGQELAAAKHPRCLHVHRCKRSAALCSSCRPSPTCPRGVARITHLPTPLLAPGCPTAGNPCLAQEDAMSEIAQHLARNASEAVRAVSPRLALRSPYRIREVEAAVPSEVQLESRCGARAGRRRVVGGGRVY